MTEDYAHFEGNSTLDHLKKARKKGAHATSEIHGTEPPGHLSAATHALKESATLSLLLWILLTPFLKSSQLYLFLGVFGFGWLLWKVGRSSVLGWSRLDRLHRLIEEERWEIEHHRAQEKEELREMYQEKGFSGKLLDEVVEILMADDNRLLRVMLEEELGLTLESFEHPLKQAVGAGIGVVIAAILAFFGIWIGSFVGLIAATLVGIIGASLVGAYAEKSHKIKAVVWNVATAFLACGATYFAMQLVNS